LQLLFKTLGDQLEDDVVKKIPEFLTSSCSRRFLNITSIAIGLTAGVKENLRLLYNLMARGRSPEGEAMMGVQAGYLQQSQVPLLNLL